MHASSNGGESSDKLSTLMVARGDLVSLAMKVMNLKMFYRDLAAVPEADPKHLVISRLNHYITEIEHELLRLLSDDEKRLIKEIEDSIMPDKKAGV